MYVYSSSDNILAMSLFADKWTSPFANNPFGLDDFHSTSYGQFRLGSNSSLFGPKSDEKVHQPLEMRLRNGSALTERGFYEHFDSILHDLTSPRSRRYDLRAAAADSSKRSAQSTGKGKEYIIPIKIQTSPKGETTSSKSTGEQSNPSTASNSPGRVIEIPIVRESSSSKSTTNPSHTTGKTRDKSRSPIVSPSSKIRSPAVTENYKIPPNFRLLTPTTEENREKRESANDVVLDCDAFFAKSQKAATQSLSRQASDIELIEIDDDEIFARSLRRKPLHHHQRSSVTSQHSMGRPTAERTADSKETESSSTSVIDHKRADAKKATAEKENKRPPCSHPGPTEVTATPSYPIYDYLKPKLAAQGRQVDYIRGDGNCFFRALSKDVYGSEDYHAECREAVCDVISSQPDLFRQYIDHISVTDHVTDMRVLGTWATTCEIYAAATLLGREIYVLAPSPSSNAEYHWLLFSPRSQSGSASGGRGGQGRENTLQPCYVTLCHTNANHYDRIIPVSDCCNCQLSPPSLNGLSVLLDLTTSDEEELLRRE